MLAGRNAIPQTDQLAKAEFTTIRERLFKIGARIIEHAGRIRIHLPTNCPDRALFRIVALGIMPSAPYAAGPCAPTSRQRRQINPNALHHEFLGAADQLVGTVARACAKHVRKRLRWCMIRARPVLPRLTYLNQTKKYGCLLPTEVRCVNQFENERQAQTDCRRSVTGQEMQDTIRRNVRSATPILTDQTSKRHPRCQRVWICEANWRRKSGNEANSPGWLFSRRM